jgi:hypothetical protein
LNHVFQDKTRCDCLTTTHAIEFDFADKWYEAVGQSLYYSYMSGEKPGIVLILENPTDAKYLTRLKNTLKYHKLTKIRVWKIEAWKAPWVNY